METKQNPGPRSCYARAMPDEPMFILLARDPAAPKAIRRWLEVRRDQPDQEEEQLADAELDCERFQDWREAHDGEWRDYKPDADLIPTPSDEISSIAGRNINPLYGLTSDTLISELASKMAEANSATEVRDNLRAVLQPFQDDLESLAGFVMRADRHAGKGNQEG